MFYQIDKRYCYPVSEECLELALYIYNNPTLKEERKLAQKIIKIYILNSFLNKNQDIIDAAEFDCKFADLNLEFNNRILVSQGFLDICFDDGFKFKATKSGKDFLNKVYNKTKDNN